MAGNWMDDRERQLRERERRERDDYRGRGGEDRSWERDRVFGERESGASYGNAGSVSRGGPAGRGWQDPGYEGVSPAMERGAYGQRPSFSKTDYTAGDYGRQDDRAGGRFYGDDSREAIYREEYGEGGYDFGVGPLGYDVQRSPSREAYHRQGYGRPGYDDYPGDIRRDFNRPASGGTGGYDYERGYGDGGRGEARGERFARAGRGAGQFLHRAGERVASWFNAAGEGRMYDAEDRRAEAGKRGLGPQGYKRSDERISDDAHDRLTDDAWLDASNISISVSGGEVTLSGTVDSREAKHRAERLVEDLPGVTHVQNNLRLAKGNFLTSPASGYGDSVLGAQMRAAEGETPQPPVGKKN